MEGAGCVQGKEESNLSWVGERAREGWPEDAGEVSDGKCTLGSDMLIWVHSISHSILPTPIGRYFP